MMTISFVSIQGNESTGWDVVKKTFPSSNRLSVTATSMNQHCKDQKIAEVAAKTIAELNRLPYVSDSASVITVARFGSCYLPVELTPNDGVIGQGTSSPSILSAIEEAMKKAERKFSLCITLLTKMRGFSGPMWQALCRRRKILFLVSSVIPYF